MTISRRRTLALIGGGTILAAGAAGGGFLATRTPSKALAPWASAGGYAEPRRRALAHAILAPNPHNLQPWMVELRGESQAAIWRDPTRALPETDPFDRQIVIGLGCFLEQMTVAATETGHAVDLELFPEGEDGPVALATFAPGAARDPLAGAILDRRSCKEPFQDQALPANVVAALAPYGSIVTDPDRVAELRTLTKEAWHIEYETPRTFKESVDVMRFGKREIEANPDGIDLGGPFLETLMLAGVMNRDAMFDQESSVAQQGVTLYDEMLTATPAYVVITTAANTRVDQIGAGRAWLRLNLATTALGLALHPVSQALQEYPEMASPYARVHEIFAPDGGTVQMLGRLGYGPTTPRTPRWSLENRMWNA